MSLMASQITSLTIVYSTVYSGADQRKHQSSAWLAFVREIHRGPVNSPHKWTVARKMFPFDDVIMYSETSFSCFLSKPNPHCSTANGLQKSDTTMHTREGELHSKGCLWRVLILHKIIITVLYAISYSIGQFDSRTWMWKGMILYRNIVGHTSQKFTFQMSKLSLSDNSLIDLLWLSDAYVRWKIQSVVVSIIPCCLFGARVLSEMIFTYRLRYPKECYSIDILSNIFHSQKYF